MNVLSDKVFGTVFTLMGAGQIIIFIFLASVLSGLMPALTGVWYGMAALLSLEAFMMLGFGLTMLKEEYVNG